MPCGFSCSLPTGSRQGDGRRRRRQARCRKGSVACNCCIAPWTTCDDRFLSGVAKHDRRYQAEREAAQQRVLPGLLTRLPQSLEAWSHLLQRAPALRC